MRRGWIVGIIAGFLALYVGGIVAYVKDTQIGIADFPTSSVPDDRLELNVTTVGIDVAKQQLSLSILPEPMGNLTDDSGFTAKKDLSFTIYTADQEKTVTLKAGQPITTIDVTISAYGNVSMYPFDHYSGWISFDSDTPFSAHWESDVQSFHANVTSDTKNGPTPMILDADVSRSFSIKCFGIFLYLLTALVAIAAVTVTVNVVWRGYEFEWGYAGWAAALLFVLPAVRSSLPGQPPIGSLADFLVFFWAEALVVFCLVALVRQWLITKKPAAEAVRED